MDSEALQEESLERQAAASRVGFAGTFGAVSGVILTTAPMFSCSQ
jgi:hypothetical protein